jgi:6-pyruvoyl-tetrahydropterin synthase
MHLFVENLTNVDFSYLDPKRGLVGETWLASIVLEGALDEQGMVCDFGIVKKTLRNWLDDTIDHSLVIAKQSSKLILKRDDEIIDVSWSYNDGVDATSYSIDCTAPSEAITLIESDIVTPESVATWCIEQLRSLLPDTIGKIQLTFTPEHIVDHSYHYSHGLKKHDGNCQRIAHGHRSTIGIYCDEQRDLEREQQWCQQWQDIYIGSADDLKNETSIAGNAYYHFAYTAQQGEFQLTLPAKDCYLIDTDTTVEFIAQHIANSLKGTSPDHSFTVRAFEGIGKGAIAFA